MSDSVLRLFPGPQAQLPVHGLYLSHRLQSFETREGTPFLYTNFIVSLDGRISLRDPVTGLRVVPPAIANPHDWRLYLELAAQADLLLTTSRHLRAFAAGRRQEVFDIRNDPELVSWRRRERLPAHPAVAALSAGLDIPMGAVSSRLGDPLIVITGSQASPERIEALRAEGVEVLQLSGGALLDGAAIAHALFALGYRTVYSVAGPRVTHALLSANVVRRLYVTTVHLALGGSEFDTLAVGEELAPPRAFTLRELYFDPGIPAGSGQLFATMDLSTNTALTL